MRLLQLISWPATRKHVLRTVLTIAGIMLGIGVFIAMHLANRSILATFNQTVDRIAGSTQLQISADESGFEEEILEKVQATPEVRVAVPVIEAVVSSGIQGQGNLKILAVDMTGDGSLRDYQISGGKDDVLSDPLVFLAQPDSLILSREFTDRNGLKVDDKIRMSTMDGEKQFTIRGIMKPGGLASAFGGNLAVMDIYSAQKVFGRGRKFDRIDLALREGVTVKQGQAALQKVLGAGFAVEPPSERGKQFESLLRLYEWSMTVCSLFALFIGMFIIYNSLSIAVIQRRKDIGILRALGATRAQIQMMFLAESAITGLIGSVLGLALGVYVASSLSGYISGLMEGIYGDLSQRYDLVLDPSLLGFGLAAGVVASVLSGVLPARAASSVDPAIALQKGRIQSIGEEETRVRQIAAGVLAAASIGCLFWSTTRVVFYIGYILVAVVALLLTPTLALWLARLLRGLLAWLRPIEGALAADSVIEAPRRTSSTVAALMFSLALVIGLAGLAQSTRKSVQDWVSATLTAPIFVSTSESMSARSFHFPAAMLPALEQIDGVEEVQPVRNLKVTFRGTPVLVLSTNLKGFAARTKSRRVIAGKYDEMHQLAAAGKGVIVSENFTELQKLGMGDELELGTRQGVLKLPIVGVIKDYSEERGTIFMDRSLFVRTWNDDAVDTFRIYLKPGASQEAVKAAIRGRFERERRLFVLSSEEVRQYIMRVVGQWFAMTYVQIAIAVLVSILGILNTLAVSISERKRELGVLRAIGGYTGQVRVTIWLEAITVGLIGLVLGLALGAVNLYYTLEMLRRAFTGTPMEYAFPWQIAFELVPIIVIAAVVAAIWPAEWAVRTPLVEALEYE